MDVLQTLFTEFKVLTMAASNYHKKHLYNIIKLARHICFKDS